MTEKPEADAPNRKKRLSAAERRQQLLEAAAFVFAERGFEGAATLAIARRAGVSEALLFRHFSSKKDLFRAVLRDLLNKQDEEMSETLANDQTVRGIVKTMKRYFEHSIEARDNPEWSSGLKVMFASLAGDGGYARSIYRRAFKRRDAAHAVETLAREGMIKGTKINSVNAALFIQHVGAMLSINNLSKRKVAPYEGDKQEIVLEALIFCLRGIGIEEEEIFEALRE